MRDRCTPGQVEGIGDARDGGLASRHDSSGQDDEVRRTVASACEDADQTLSDAEQRLADRDQAASDSDHLSARADQDASDRDQATADREEANGPTTPVQTEAYARSRAERLQTTADRISAEAIRLQAVLDREGTARERDRQADERDRVAEERDRAELAAERARLEACGASDAALAALAAAHARAAEYRERAAADRARAAADRAAAARDRAVARAALRHAYHDGLTGALRREVGDLVLQHELDRALRADGRLSVAFIDVDGLKQVNDQRGHAAGDALLTAVVSIMRRRLRSFDPIVRYGGDEFVCALAGTGEADTHRRFEDIKTAIAREHPGASISVGIAQLRPAETLADVLARGDAALYAARRQRQAPTRQAETNGAAFTVDAREGRPDLR